MGLKRRLYEHKLWNGLKQGGTCNQLDSFSYHVIRHFRCSAKYGKQLKSISPLGEGPFTTSETRVEI